MRGMATLPSELTEAEMRTGSASCRRGRAPCLALPRSGDAQGLRRAPPRGTVLCRRTIAERRGPARGGDPNLLLDPHDETFLRPWPSGDPYAWAAGGHTSSRQNVHRRGDVKALAKWQFSWFKRIGLFSSLAENVSLGPLRGQAPRGKSAWTVIPRRTQGVTPGSTSGRQGQVYSSSSIPGRAGTTGRRGDHRRIPRAATTCRRRVVTFTRTASASSEGHDP